MIKDIKETSIRHGLVKCRVKEEFGNTVRWWGPKTLREMVFYRTQTFLLVGPLPLNSELHPDCYWMILE